MQNYVEYEPLVLNFFDHVLPQAYPRMLGLCWKFLMEVLDQGM